MQKVQGERLSSQNPQVFMQWMTVAYRQTEKSKAWYVLMILILGIFIVYDLYTGGWVVSVTLLIMAGVYYMNDLKRVPTVQVSITDHGIRFGAQYFPFNQIKAFWILDEEGVRQLNIIKYKGTPREVSIIVSEEVNTAKLREYLQMQILEEEGRKESFVDQLIRNLGL